MDIIDLHSLAGTQPGFTYRQAAPAAPFPRPPPFFTAGPLPAEFETWFHGDEWVPAVGVLTAENIELSRDRLLTWNGKTLTIPQNNIDPSTVANIALADGRHRRIEPPVALLCGPGHLIYGHWLVDFLPRLHVLAVCGHDITQLHYLLPYPMGAFIPQWMNLLGIPNTQIIPYDVNTEICSISHAIIPTNLRGHNRAHPFLADAIKAYKNRLSLGEEHATRKLFVSRRSWRRPSRRLVNVEAIEAIFQAHGFEIVFPETMPIPDQIRLFASARVIAGEYGSGLHNAIFAPAGATIIALRGTHAHPWFLQSGLCEVFNQNCGYIFGQTETLNQHQIFSIAPADVTGVLERLNI